MGTQIQVISATGQYESCNIQAFLERNNLGCAGVSYTTVAIMGPQSSGKSTLLNTVVRNTMLLVRPTAGVSDVLPL